MFGVYNEKGVHMGEEIKALKMGNSLREERRKRLS